MALTAPLTSAKPHGKVTGVGRRVQVWGLSSGALHNIRI